MEEPGNLEISLNPLIGLPQTGQRFLGLWTEFEYGVKGWWTTEVYIDGQTTRGESTLFTGFRWENRFRPLAGHHWINPVLYVEFESINGADKTLLEVVNHDSVEDLATPNAEARSEKKHEVEGKLILSSNYKGWNISENFISEKNPTNLVMPLGSAARLPSRRGPIDAACALRTSRPVRNSMAAWEPGISSGSAELRTTLPQCWSGICRGARLSGSHPPSDLTVTPLEPCFDSALPGRFRISAAPFGAGFDDHRPGATTHQGKGSCRQFNDAAWSGRMRHRPEDPSGA